MNTSEPPAQPCCHHCGDVIGVYEPLVMVVDGLAHQSSRASELERESPGRVGNCYHSACYQRLDEERLLTG